MNPRPATTADPAPARPERAPDPFLAERLRAELDGIPPWRRRLDRTVLGALGFGAGWLVDRWLLLVNAAVALTLAGAVAAPLLEAAGFGAAAAWVHQAYLLLCPQRPSHSYFLFGHQLALEQRELAMFAGQLVGGLLYARYRGRVRGLDWRLMLLLTLPIAYDGFSQTFGWRESTWLLRTVTGGLFDLALAFWLYPLLDRLAAIGRPVGWDSGG